MGEGLRDGGKAFSGAPQKIADAAKAGAGYLKENVPKRTRALGSVLKKGKDFVIEKSAGAGKKISGGVKKLSRKRFTGRRSGGQPPDLRDSG